MTQLGCSSSSFFYGPIVSRLGIKTPPARSILRIFQKRKPAWINPELEAQVNTARTLTSLALSLRKKEQIKVRQPLQKMMIPVKNTSERERMERIVAQLKSEINLKGD